jgi:hypothetical protein
VLDGATVPKAGDTVSIYLRTPQSRVAVMRGNLAIGRIEGEAAKYLCTLFSARPDLCNILDASVVSAPDGAGCIEIELAVPVALPIEQQ